METLVKTLKGIFAPLLFLGAFVVVCLVWNGVFHGQPVLEVLLLIIGIPVSMAFPIWFAEWEQNERYESCRKEWKKKGYMDRPAYEPPYDVAFSPERNTKDSIEVKMIEHLNGK